MTKNTENPKTLLVKLEVINTLSKTEVMKDSNSSHFYTVAMCSLQRKCAN